MLRFLFFTLVLFFVGLAQNTHAESDLPRSLYLEQAYDHFTVLNSRNPGLTRRGVELFLKNRFINEAYDFLQSRGQEVNVNEVDGIVVDLKHNTNIVHFLGRDVTGGIKGVFGVEFKGNKAVYVHFPKVPKRVKDMYEVYVVAQKAVKGPCKLDYNTIVIPTAGGEHLVYTLVADPHPVSIVVGGHFQLKVHKDDEGRWKIREYIPYDTLCVPINRSFINDKGQLPINYNALPNEVHSFLSLQYGYDILLNSATDKWLVSKGIMTPHSN